MERELPIGKNYGFNLLLKRAGSILSFALISIFSLAQNGPGGVGTADGTSNLKMWLRADRNVSYDNLKNIVSWTDYSGNNIVLTSSGTSPVFAGNTLNGMPVVNFRSNAAGLVLAGVTGNDLFSPSDNTVVFVKQSASGAYWFSWQGTIPTDQVSFYLSANREVFDFPNNTTGRLTGSVDITGAYHILSNRTDGTTQTVFADGVQDASQANTQTLSTAAAANMYLGTFDGTPSNGWTGYIAEGLFFNTDLNSAELTLVENYLSAKYALPISNDRYAGDDIINGNYDFDIAGIGSETNGKNSISCSSGLYLTENGNSLSAGEYIVAGHANQLEILSASDLTGGVSLRWNRDWYIEKTGGVDAKISFDFSEGINGGTPGNPAAYVLLFRSGVSGSFVPVAGVTAAVENTDQVYFNLSNADLTTGHYTLGTTNAVESPLDGVKTWYNYSVDESDSWDNWERWTLDPDGSLLINPYHLTPGGSDNVVILNGGTVNITGAAAKAAALLEIRTGGTLTISGTSPEPSFDVITGDGLIRLAADNYPGDGANDAEFNTRGTVEYTGDGYSLMTATSYYNLVINLAAPSSTVTLKSNLNVAGNFTVPQGIFRINDDADNVKYTVNVAGNVTIPGSGGQISTGPGDPTGGAYSYSGTMPASGHFHDIYHEFIIGGDFTSFGTVRFTNLTAPLYDDFAGNGAVTVRFNGENNNTVSLYGPATFYNLIIDKGTSQSYITTLYSADVANFNIYGGNAAGVNVTEPFSNADPEVRKAIYIKNGTLKLTGNINIHSLSEGNIGGGNGDYVIGSRACLWLAGAGITVFSTANSGAQAPAGAAGVNPASGDQAMSVYGKFRISDGMFGTHNSAGLIFWSDYSGVVQIEGGTVDVAQLRSGSSTAVKSVYIQSGGTLNVRGDRTEAGEISTNYPLFGLVTSADNFIMSGGTVNILDVSPGTGYGGNSFYINSAEGNYSVTGGDINIIVDGNTTFPIYSTANLWNLNLHRANSVNTLTIRLNSDLAVYGNLLVDEGSVVDMTASGASRSLSVRGNLTLGSTGTATNFFTTGTGAPATTVSFTGSGNSVINIYNTGTAGLFSPFHFVINKDNAFDTVSVFSAGRAAGTSPLNIKGNFTISNGTFDYGTFTVDVQGSLSNNGVMGIWNRTGRIRLNNATALQTIAAGNDPGAIFGHIEAVHTDGSANWVQLNSNASCDLFTLTSGRVYIQNYKLSVDTNYIAFTEAANPSDRMIFATNDNANRGLQLKMSYNYNTASSITFPVGTYDGTNYRWSKCVVSVAATVGSVSGYLTVSPVPQEHPSKVGGGCINLAYYWKTIASGLESTTGGVQYAFSSPLPNPAGGGNKEYFLLNGGTWTADDNYSPTLTFEAADIGGFATGDFTAGKNACFNNVNYVFSNGTGGGVWNNGASWLSGSPPQIFDVAVIRSGDIITVGRNNSDDAGTVIINAGGTLDAGIYTGLNYGIIQGGGKFRIASNSVTSPTLPAGDFDPFLLNDTAVFEYYGSGSYTLPAAVSYYPTLKIGGSAGTVKTLPAAGITVNHDLLIFDDVNLSVVLAMNNSATPGYDLTVRGNMKFDRAGVFRFPATGATRNVLVEKSIDFNTNGNTYANVIEIEDAAGSHSPFHRLDVRKDILMNPNARVTLFRSIGNRRAVDLFFTGPDSSRITASASTLALNTLTLNKDLLISQLQISSDISFTTANVRPVTLVQGHLILDNSNINISLSTGAGNFTIPSTGKLSLRNGSVANITGIATGLSLDGALSVEDNSQMLVNDGVNDNFIEYGSTGFSSVSVSGAGTLTVGSQIRRKITSESGILMYSQSGGTVTVGNSSAPAGSRGVFEIFSPGGSFNFTGGNLIVARSQSTSQPAVYIDPESFVITGGATVTFGNANTPGGSSIGLYSSVPLKDIVVSNSGGTKTVKMYTLGLVIDSLIINSGQFFDANGKDLTLNGNFHNQGMFSPGSNTTSFTGSSQKIIGATAFNNLLISTADSVILRSDITVNGNLDITAGQLSDCAKTITLKGNFSNNGIHYSVSNSGGGVLFNGPARQRISGLGVFGRMTIDNYNGAELQNDFKLVDRNISLINGSLYIRQHKLQLGQKASIVTPGSFGKDRMIVTNGAISDKGVERAVTSGSHSGILIPVGVTGKYTPVYISQINAVGNGFIHVRPVSQPHPTMLDPDNVLQYYWNLQTTGFSSFTGSLDFSYSQSDVAVTAPAVESDYIPAYLNGTSWAKFGSEDVDANLNIVGFNFTSGENLDGDFTAGINTAMPDIVAVYYTTKDGAWEDSSVWAREDGAAVNAYPVGYVVKIRHNITVNQDLKSSYKTIIEAGGALNIGTTIGHYLGQVSGTGRLYIASGRLPAGNYENFFACSGGTMEFGGTASYDIPDEGSTYRELIISGGGTKTLSSTDLNICESFIINGPTVDNSTHNNRITLSGSFALIAGSFKSGTGSNATLVFSGTSIQTLTGNFTGGSKLNNIQMDNAAGLTLVGDVTMSGLLTLSSGMITTGVSNFTMEVAATASPSTGTPSSFIDGPLSKIMASGSSFTFPVGKSNRNGMFTAVSTLTSGAGTWRVEYFNTGTPNRLPANLGPGLADVSDEYWTVTPPAGSTPVTLRWDASSNINGITAGGISNIRLVQYIGTLWTIRPATTGGSSTNLNGTITTNGPISFSAGTPVNFAIGSAVPLLPTATFLSGDTSVCAGESVDLQIALTNGTTWTLVYNDGTPHTVSAITSSPYTLTLTPSATTTYSLTSVTNQVPVSGVATGSVTVTVNQFPVADFSYSGSPYCPNAADPVPTFVAGGIAGTFSSTPGLTFINTATGQVDLSASTQGTYTVINTVAAPGGCGDVTATGTITVITDLVWTGVVSSDWNEAGNWACGFIPGSDTPVQIPDVPVKPIVNTGAIATVLNLTIANGSSLLITDNTIRISGSVTNNGLFNSLNGTVEMNGTVPQVFGTGITATSTVRSLVVNNTSGVTLQGPVSITGSVVSTNGNLASDGFLTLVSTAAGTAYIDGAGAGNITGNVTMQRYLPSVYGYKYVSTPFQSSTVAELGDDMDLASSFPLIYRYDEARTSSGWVGYASAANMLIPLRGYSVNFGVAGTPGTVDISGVVNNGPLSLTLANNNNTYTKGFHLVGNPYPSAIDWNAAGWTKTNIDNAVYYFRASTTDQYGGTYSSYINGISTDPGIATNIIPSMQGFFVHVSDGSYPVTGTLSLDNSVRINDLSHNFLKSAEASERFLIRATASFTDDPVSSDPTVIYFTTGASPGFDGGMDALKLLNTDMLVANVYSMLAGGTRLSVNALPESADTALLIPLGLRTNRDGEVQFRIRDLENLPVGVQVYFRDKTTGANINMLPDRDYKIVLTAGTYNDRFSLAFLKSTTGIEDPEASSDLFTAYASKGLVRATVWALEGKEGAFTIYDLSGQPLFVQKVYERGRLEFNPRVKPGVYIVSFVTGSRRGSLKMALGFR